LRRQGLPQERSAVDRLMLIMDGLNAGGAVRGRAGAAPAGVAFAEEVIRHALGPRGTDMRPES
jgi:hypothetical protein